MMLNLSLGQLFPQADKGKQVSGEVCLKISVKISDYDANWPVIYAREKDLILSVIGGKARRIEHVGSTAVPGLGAKPIIDIMIGLGKLSDAKDCVRPLKSIGYVYVPGYEKETPDRRYFRKGPEGVPNTHFHLHMVKRGGPFWKRHLLFRDYLRCHRDVAKEYDRLKKDLARKYPSNREAYTQAKTSLIDSVVAKALATSRLHLRFLRLPAQVLEMYDELVFKSEKVIVGKSQVSSVHSLEFDGKTVLKAGFPITYFELMRKWFSVVKVRNLRGRHTGYYCDIATPPRLLKDGTVELTDLFLDLWVSPDLKYRVLDEDQLEEALRKGWITKRLYEKARMELQKLVAMVEQRRFPPQLIKRLEDKLGL
jgi:GrpB-like predicted nucleotidyltransferase (UPF0157 family)/predicted RNA-binding protein associated with RNAse of E/G family